MSTSVLWIFFFLYLELHKIFGDHRWALLFRTTLFQAILRCWITSSVVVLMTAYSNLHGFWVPLFVYCLGLLLKSQLNLILLSVRSGWIIPGDLSPVSKWPINFSQLDGFIRKSGKSQTEKENTCAHFYFRKRKCFISFVLLVGKVFK